MLIPIRSEDNTDPPSWAMIELQGEIDRKMPSIDSRKDSLDDVGTLTASSSVRLCREIGGGVRASHLYLHSTLHSLPLAYAYTQKSGLRMMDMLWHSLKCSVLNEQ